MNCIVKSVNRPSESIIKKIGQIPTPVLSDVMGRQNCMDSRINQVYKGAKFCGPAFTVKSYPSDNLMLHVGLKLAEKGDVLVVDAGGYSNAGLWGEMMSTQAKVKGISGLVIDGGVRDVRELEEMDFPVFSSGINARGGFKNIEGSVNIPISCGGISVNPGDIIVADENGVVVVNKDDVENVYKKATEKIRYERESIERVKKGELLFNILELDKVLEKLGTKVIE